MAVTQHMVDKLQFRNVSVPKGSAGLIGPHFLSRGTAGTPAAAGARQVPPM